MMTQINIENFPSYELGMEKGMERGMVVIIEQLLKTLSPEQVAKLTNLPLENIVKIAQQKTKLTVK